MSFAVITRWNAGNRVTKFIPCATQAEADAVAVEKAPAFPGCFAVEEPMQGAGFDCIVDPVAKTITYDPFVEDPAVADARKAATAAELLGRAVDEVFLDGFWLVFKAIAPIGVAAIDNAVTADDRAAFDRFFRDRVKAKL